MSRLELLLSLDIDGDPVAKGRPRVSRDGHLYTPKITRDAEKLLAEELRLHIRRPTSELCEVTLDFRTATNRRTDIDNFAKLVLDAANKIVWEDDRQVVWLLVEIERGSRHPGTSITVRTRR